MIIQTSFTVNSLFEDCVAQNAIDFKALRLHQPENADMLYPDYVMSSDVLPEFQKALTLEAATFNAKMTHLSPEFIRGIENLEWMLTVSDEAGCACTLGTLIFSLFKYRMLAWWYSGRDEQLQLLYSVRADEQFNLIRSQTDTSFGGRKLRHF